MSVIATVRSILLAARRGALGALLISSVVSGLLSMHALYGAFAMHSHDVVATASTAVQAEGETDSLDPAYSSANHEHPDACECCETDTPCLTLTAATVPLLPPATISIQPPGVGLPHRASLASTTVSARRPSLHALGISRT
ncbi:hypothetical protein [Myceligenerans crystallogenes]|uniref:DUF2946 domain-containing protein n=1 Tax=Myceligenerans crystallogenes TaxID=316335 RepID=A0ABN2ND72_9MICO